MASPCIRSIARTSLFSVKSHSTKCTAAAAIKGSTSPSPHRRLASISRLPVELGCMGGGSMFPLHSAVAAARLTSRLSTASRSCRDLSQGTLCRTYPGL